MMTKTLKISDETARTDATSLERLAAADERLRTGVNPGATLSHDDERRTIEIVKVEKVTETDWPEVAELAREAGIVRWARYEEIERHRSGVLGETADGEVFNLKLRDGEIQLEGAEVRVPMADGGSLRAQMRKTGMDYEARAAELEAETALTAREADVQALKEQGLSHSEIADELALDKSTVDAYSARINDRIERSRATLEELEGDR